MGDSYIQFLKSNKLINQNSVNFGIAGQTTLGLIDLLNSDWDIRTKKIVLLIGFNDFKYRSEKEVFKNLAEIKNRLISLFKLKSNNIIVLSLLPVDKNRYVLNQKIRNLNKRLKAHSQENAFIYLDVHSLFIEDINNETYKFYMPDLVHLNKEGYLKLSKFLNSKLILDKE